MGKGLVTHSIHITKYFINELQNNTFAFISFFSKFKPTHCTTLSVYTECKKMEASLVFQMERLFCSKISAPQAGYVSVWLGCWPALRGLERLCVRSYKKFVILKEQKFSQALCSLEQFQHLSIEQYLPFLSRHCLFCSETQVEMICF